MLTRNSLEVQIAIAKKFSMRPIIKILFIKIQNYNRYNFFHIGLILQQNHWYRSIFLKLLSSTYYFQNCLFISTIYKINFAFLKAFSTLGNFYISKSIIFSGPTLNIKFINRPVIEVNLPRMGHFACINRYFTDLFYDSYRLKS